MTAVGVFPDPPLGLVTAIRTDRGQVACRMDRTLCRCASSSFPGFGVARPRLSTLSTVRRRPHSAGGSGGAGGTHPPSVSTSVDPARFLREPVPRHHPAGPGPAVGFGAGRPAAPVDRRRRGAGGGGSVNARARSAPGNRRPAGACVGVMSRVGVVVSVVSVMRVLPLGRSGRDRCWVWVSRAIGGDAGDGRLSRVVRVMAGPRAAARTAGPG